MKMKQNFTSLLRKNFIFFKLINCLFFVFGLLVFSAKSYAQVLITLNKETFPSTYNTGFAAPVNETFGESIGIWSALSTGNATIVATAAPYSAVTNSIKIMQPGTSGLGAADSYATSPTINLSNAGCNSKYDFSFKLYTYNCISGDNNAYLAVDFSKDNGTTWSTVWQKTSGQIWSSHGVNAVVELWLALPSTYFTTGFRYRFRGHNNANNANNFYVFVDDPTVYAFACSSTMSLGNLVWLDANENGIKDGLEAGIPGVNIQLTRDDDGDGINDPGFTPQTTVTNLSGNYVFNNLEAGNYQMSLINVPNLHHLVLSNAGDPDEDQDNNNNGINQSSALVADGGWITLLPESEPTNDGDDNNGNMTYDFAVAPGAALPLRSIRLNTELTAGTVLISWTTTGEINTSYFEIERSTNIGSFVKVATKSAAGIMGGDATYSIENDVSSVISESVYYRIKAVDKDGRFSYSAITVVKLASSTGITVWPNPFANDVKINYTATAAGKLFMKLTDASGMVIKWQISKIEKGINQITFTDLQNIAAGNYTIDVFDATAVRRCTAKLIKQK
jgi:SdrD B-like domain